MSQRRPPARIEPRIKPVKGVVQPPVVPPANRPGRRTNQLEFLSKHLNAIWRHSAAHIFRQPVNAEELNIPTYHDVIIQPMDMKTIRQRLANKYYWCVKEAIDDFNLMFFNCSKFNPPETTVHQMGNEVKQFFMKTISALPKEELELPDSPLKAPTRATKGRPRTAKSKASKAKRPTAKKNMKKKGKQAMLQCNAVGKHIPNPKNAMASVNLNVAEKLVKRSETSSSSANNQMQTMRLSNNIVRKSMNESKQRQRDFAKDLTLEWKMLELAKGLKLLSANMQNISDNLTKTRKQNNNRSTLQAACLIGRNEGSSAVSISTKHFRLLKYENPLINTNKPTLNQIMTCPDMTTASRILTNSEKNFLYKIIESASVAYKTELCSCLVEMEERPIEWPVEMDTLKPTTLWYLYSSSISLLHSIQTPEVAYNLISSSNKSLYNGNC